MKIGIKNPAHREFIEEHRCFDVVDLLGVKCCSLCSARDVLTLVPDDAPDRRFHHYSGTAQCVALPVCDGCFEQAGPDPEEWLSRQRGMDRCSDVGCVTAAEDLREIRALKGDPLFYGYEAYPSVYNMSVSIDEDITWAGAFRPAGDIWAFATEEERDAWVREGSTAIFNSFGYIEKFRCRSAIPAETGRRLYASDWDRAGRFTR